MQVDANMILFIIVSLKPFDASQPALASDVPAERTTAQSVRRQSGLVWNGARVANVGCQATREATMALEEQIRNYAYQLWEKAGRPEGWDQEFWEAAKSELDAEDENPDTADQPNASILPG